jgi:folate-dependent phosphoribosylglycinamide formyltransferase PurN
VTAAGRIVVLATPGRSTNALVNRLAEHFAEVHLVLEQPEGRWRFVRRRAKRIGWRRVLGQVAFLTAVAPLLERASATRIEEIVREHDLFLGSPHVPTTRVASVNDPDTPQTVAALSPDVVVLSGTRIIRADVLAGFGAVALNVHAGITPAYRGVHGGYWALACGDRARCGVTVHVVDPGVDTGPVVGQAQVAVTEHDGYATLPLLQAATALPILVEALTAIVRGQELRCTSPGGESRQWYHPTTWEYVRNRLGRGLR